VDDAGDRRNRLTELMVAYQAGDAMAFEKLYGEVAGPILGYLRSLTRDAARAEDLQQETFFHVHRARHTFHPERSAKAWIFAIAHNVFLMSHRAAGRLARHEGLAENELPDVPIPPALEALAARDVLQRALARLPEKQREALLLHHVQGLSFQEVGGVQGVTALAAKLRSHRAMTELRELIRGEGR